MASLLRTSVRAARSTPATFTMPAAMASTTFVRTKATLPDLPYDYSALEPHISTSIMKLHHTAHHQTYVNGLNAATTSISAAHEKGDFTTAASLAPLLNFHGGGHLNHTLFWENLAPSSGLGGSEPSVGSPLETAISASFGSLSDFKTKMNGALAGIQGSGWAWLVKDGGKLSIVTRANQDPVTGGLEPLLGIDAWEHAYYLQYQNRKAEYFSAIWNVVNWETVAQRMEK